MQIVIAIILTLFQLWIWVERAQLIPGKWTALQGIFSSWFITVVNENNYRVCGLCIDRRPNGAMEYHAHPSEGLPLDSAAPQEIS